MTMAKSTNGQDNGMETKGRPEKHSCLLLPWQTVRKKGKDVINLACNFPFDKWTECREQIKSALGSPGLDLKR